MTLPALSQWDSTRSGLHQAAQVMGGIRKAVAEALPNYAHLGLFVTRTGLTTGKLPEGDQLFLDFTTQGMTYICPANTHNPVALAGHTQTTLTDAVVQAMTKTGHGVEPDRAKISGTETFEINPGLASDYAGALHSIFSAMARFRGRLLGSMSPMIVWPHGFDLSSLWFARGSVEGQDPHLNFGFSPGSPGFARPYVYIYAHPMPVGMFEIPLPAHAEWTRERWTGIVIDYDYLAGQADHEAVLEGMLGDIFRAAAPLLK